jgi:hypothetical protein
MSPKPSSHSVTCLSKAPNNPFWPLRYTNFILHIHTQHVHIYTYTQSVHAQTHTCTYTHTDDDNSSDEGDEKGKAALVGRKPTSHASAHFGSGAAAKGPQSSHTQSKAQRQALLFGGYQASDASGEGRSAKKNRKKKQKQTPAEASCHTHTVIG